MDGRLLKAAVTGDARLMKQLASQDPAMLLGTTPQGNTCLHISSIHGHEGFCRDAVALNGSLLNVANKDGETPLLTAVTRDHATLASVLFRCCKDQRQNEAILKQDKRGDNGLHHAISGGHKMLALELIQAEPALSKAVNQVNESPMFVAVMRCFTDVVDKLLEIPGSAHSGALGFSVLHAAVKSGNSVIAKAILETRPELVGEENENKHTPVHLAVNDGKVDLLTVFLEHDPSLGYLVSTDGSPLLCIAASQGHVGVARELLKHCPDAPYCNANGSTCLHLAVSRDHARFVDFVLKSQQLQHLIKVTDKSGQTPLRLPSSARNTKEEKEKDKEKDKEKQDMYTVAALQFPLILGLRRCPMEMDPRLQEAAIRGHAAETRHLALQVPGILLGTTPHGNTCLHIASMYGYDSFCNDVTNQEPSLLASINLNNETPLLAAVTSGRVSVANVLLRCCLERQLRETILKQDKHGCNVLHHAIRSGYRELALKLIEAEPVLSNAVNQYNESPMYIAVMRNYADVFEKLLKNPDSSHSGAGGYNSLHAAVRNGNSDIADKIMNRRPRLAREEDDRNDSPVRLAVFLDKIEVLKVLLKHDRSLGYVVSTKGSPLLATAAYRGHVDVARELLKYCPDAPFCSTDGFTSCLHTAIRQGQIEFVKFVLDSPQLGRLINMRDSNGNTPLHIAVKNCNPKIVAALLEHQDTDVSAINNWGNAPYWMLSSDTDQAKTLNWNEVSMLVLKADPERLSSIRNLHKQAKDKVINSSKKDIKSLTLTYTGNTSLVAILIATITFAAAFTLPGGYSSDTGSEGLPIMARKFAFQAFLVADTLAMCSSLVVAFICIIARWQDLEFLLYYRSFTKKLMWFAYMSTTTAFATGLYTGWLLRSAP